MTINIISQSTAERNAETKALYEACKPYLDKGMTLYHAIIQVKGIKPTNSKNGWYRDLIEYSISQGYDYYGHKWQRQPKEEVKP